jgi:phosphatidylglycerophosphate synthase
VRACVLAAAGVGAELEVAGLAVAERTRRALRAAGFELAPSAEHSNGAHTLFVAGDAVIDPNAARALVAAAEAGQGVMSAGDSIEAPAALVVPGDASDVAVLASADALGPLAARLRAGARLRLAATGDGPCQRVRSRGDAARLERALLAGLVQPSDGFFARHFDRLLSSRLSPVLVRHGVAPNTITLVATAVGLAGALCLTALSQGLQLLGALLFIASTILDGCDGEVARLAFRSSEFGRRLDLIGDNLVNAGVFVAIGWGAIRADEGSTMTTLVWVTLGGFALATVAGFTFSRWLERSGRGAHAHHWYESLASRDFAYFVLLLVVLGRLHWFVWFAAIGSYSFVLVVAAIRLRAGRNGPTPPAPPVGEQQWA